MEVKFDTKEKFNVATPITADITDKEAAELSNLALAQLDTSVKNLIFNFSNVSSITNEAAESLAELYNIFLEKNASLIFCQLTDNIKNTLEEMEILEILNVTPTESEAWDIVQMEEMERELFNDENN